MISRITLSIIFALASFSAFSQPAVVKKSAKAVFSLNTFRSDGTPLATSYGVFISSDGYAISQWKPFVGAAKAFVVDSNGKKYDVEGLVGANDLYDVCKFKVQGQTPFAPVSKEFGKEGEELWLACYKVKAPRLLHSNVKNIEQFSTNTALGEEKSYGYYILNLQTPDNVLFTPLIDNVGNIVALLHTESKGGTANAVSAAYPHDIVLQQLGTSATTLSQSIIPVILPDNYQEAQAALMVQSRKGEAYKATLDYFIRKFPKYPDGYEKRSRYMLASGNYSSAERDIMKAIELSADKAEQHYAFSQLILDKVMYMPADSLPQWTLEKALEEVEKAFALKDSPLFLNQKAKVLTVMKRYEEACQVYLTLQGTSLAGPDIMLSATQCKKLSGAPFADVEALMDSTIACCPKPLTYQSAPYVLQRGAMYQEEGMYRKAITEYNTYERLLVGYTLRPDFFYNRFLCEREGKLYQQALDDISKAIEISPDVELYHSEKASLLLRLRMNDEALAEANRALLINPESADAFAVIGVAQCVTGKKHEGIMNLHRAKELGHPNADALIKKYE